MNEGGRKLRLLIVDDHTLVREGVAGMLSKEPDLQVIATCASVGEGVQTVKREPVDIVLLDYSLGEEHGSAFISLAREAGYQGKILVVTASLSDFSAVELIRMGVRGIFLKQGTPELLAKAVRKVAGGEIWLDQHHLNLMMRAVTSPESLDSSELTERQAAVLKRISDGYTNKQIASELGVTETSVKSAIQQLFEKHHVRTRGQLVRVAVEQYPNLK